MSTNMDQEAILLFKYHTYASEPRADGWIAFTVIIIILCVDICVCVCVCMSVCASPVCPVLREAREGYRNAWDWSYRWLGPTIEVHAIELGSSRQASCALNHWALSLALSLITETDSDMFPNPPVMEIEAWTTISSQSSTWIRRIKSRSSCLPDQDSPNWAISSILHPFWKITPYSKQQVHHLNTPPLDLNFGPSVIRVDPDFLVWPLILTCLTSSDLWCLQVLASCWFYLFSLLPLGSFLSHLHIQTDPFLVQPSS